MQSNKTKNATKKKKNLFGQHNRNYIEELIYIWVKIV